MKEGENVNIPKQDRDILRELGRQKAEIAALPVHAERKAMWARLNRLEQVKPMICIYQEPWNEIKDPSMELRCTSDFCKGIEFGLRMELYKWEHQWGDIVMEPVQYCGLAINDTGFGISEKVDVVGTDPTSGVVSRHFHIQVSEVEDAAKIQMPVVTHDTAVSRDRLETMRDIFDGVLEVQQRGQGGFWFAPWDELIRWTGVEDGLANLYLKPEVIHAAMDRLVNAYLCRLDQYEKQGLLALNNNTCITGSGGYGYTDQLPPRSHEAAHVRTRDLWGCATAQIFGDVSPAMHDEFALQYELRWLKRFGLNYYGCCEPLHKKVGMLSKVPRLRKISMSPWANDEEGAEVIGRKYVFSMKPTPAFLAEDRWRPDGVRAYLRERLAKTRNCCVEIVLKDISTIRYEPARLHEWARIAAEVAKEFEP